MRNPLNIKRIQFNGFYLTESQCQDLAAKIEKNRGKPVDHINNLKVFFNHLSINNFLNRGYCDIKTTNNNELRVLVDEVSIMPVFYQSFFINGRRATNEVRYYSKGSRNNLFDTKQESIDHFDKAHKKALQKFEDIKETLESIQRDKGFSISWQDRNDSYGSSFANLVDIHEDGYNFDFEIDFS